MNVIGNNTNTDTTKQGIFLAPPSLARKRKDPKNTFLSFIDETPNGFGSAKLVRKEPKNTKDIYFTVRTRTTSVLSRRRNSTHVSVVSYRTKKGGSTRENIAFMNCSFLEIDGSNDNTIKSRRDVEALVKRNNLPTASYTIQTSPGHFHLIWNYSRPLPFTEKGESYWTAQQKRLIQLFEQSGFLVDKMASLNPCQNLRNPSQLNAYNYKRRCQVFIFKSYQKTSLRRLYRALNGTSIANPKRVQASVKLRRYLRANQTFEITLSQLAENLKTSLRTVKTQVSRAVSNGDLRITARLGNNAKKTRRTQYESLLFIERIPEVQLSILKANSLPAEGLLRDFKRKGTSVGRRQKIIFALGLEIKSKLGERACIEAIRAELEGGAMRCHFPEREFERTLKNIMKPIYGHPFSLPKLQEWDLIAKPEHSRKKVSCIEG